MQKNLLLLPFIALTLVYGLQLQAQYDNGSEIFSNISANTTNQILYNYMVEDLDRDGIKDIIMVMDSTASLPYQFTWMKGDGEGGFSLREPFFELSQYDPNSNMFYVDMNGDGNKSLVIQDGPSNFKTFGFNEQGNKNSEMSASIVTSDLISFSIKDIADIDEDGDQDILFWGHRTNSNFSRQNAGYILIGYNDGNGAFSDYQSLDNDTSSIFNLIETGDIDGDGDLDIVCSGNASFGKAGGFGPNIFFEPFVRVYENLGAGVFAVRQEIDLPTIAETPPDLSYIRLEDLDDDGNVELLIEYAIRDECSDVHQSGCNYFYRFHILDYTNGAFTRVEEYNAPLHAYTVPSHYSSQSQYYTESFLVQYMDNNNDTYLDALTVNVAKGQIQWLNGDGNGGFSNSQKVNENSLYSNVRPALRAADVDNDGDLDIFALANEGNSSQLFLYRSSISTSTEDPFNTVQSISFAPNPANGNAYVTYTLPEQESVTVLNYKIMNINGQQVDDCQCDHDNIFIGGLATGMYFVELRSKENIYANKLLISK